MEPKRAKELRLKILKGESLVDIATLPEKEEIMSRKRELRQWYSVYEIVRTFEEGERQ